MSIKNKLKDVPGLLAVRDLVFGAPLPSDRPEGAVGVAALGHREYVGGLWDVMGPLELSFLQSRGLRPEHYLIDVACGCLRGGVHFIPYLDTGHYMGIEKEQTLVDAGLDLELDPGVRAAKRPHLLVDATFAFHRLPHKADFALANSLFSHFPEPLVEECLTKLLPAMRPGGQFFATFYESDTPVRNPKRPHDHGLYRFTRAQMLDLGRRTGWQAEYIGGWGHPSGQVMMRYASA